MRPILWAVLGALCALAAPVHAQDLDFAVTAETRALAGDAPVIVRAYETEFEVRSPGRATTRVRLVATALNPAGRETVGRMNVVYGGFRDLKRLEGTLRGADGRVIRKLGRRDAEDRSITTASFYDDLRVRSAELYADAYPFTVEWRYEIDHLGVLGWPTWYPQPEGRPVERATFRLDVPAGTVVRSRAQRLEVEPAVVEERRRTIRTRTLGPLAALKAEPLGPPWEAQAPSLALGTDAFEIGGATGRLDSWEAFGAWYGRLGRGRAVLPEAAREEVERLVADAPDEREAVRRLYRHLQQTTRYVSIQLGLGGWQPFDAAYVYERRYGDCKALTNYMQALLAAAGIPAEPALVAAGSDAPDLDPDFPDNYFNHVILRVPLADGPVWLEATSPVAAFGHLGPFTEDRHVLLVTPSGGELARTPRSSPDENLTRQTGTVRLDARGGATVEATWHLTGAPRSDAIGALADRPAAEQAQWLHASLALPGFDVRQMDVGALRERPDTLALGAELVVANYARRAGRRLLVPLNSLSAPVVVPPVVETRTQPVWLGHPYAERAHVRLLLPDGFGVDALPEPVTLDAGFARYTRTVALSEDGGAVLVTRDLSLDETRLPAEAYDEVRAFFQAVARADSEVAVLTSGQP